MNLDDVALRMACALTARWQIGESSRFCDDGPDWDSADEKDVAKVIVRYLKVLAKSRRKERCENCRHYFQSETTYIHLDASGKETKTYTSSSLCVLHPPTVDGWPRVGPCCRCGKFEVKL